MTKYKLVGYTEEYYKATDVDEDNNKFKESLQHLANCINEHSEATPMQIVNEICRVWELVYKN